MRKVTETADRSVQSDSDATADKYVYAFTEGRREMADELGGKGRTCGDDAARFAGSSRLHDQHSGLSVLPRERRDARRPRWSGSTLRCTSWKPPAERTRRPKRSATRLGEIRLAVFDAGMMETVLDIGLNDHSVIGLAKIADDERFAWDSYRRLIQMFGKTVLEIDGDRFEVILARAIRREGSPQIPNWAWMLFVPTRRELQTGRRRMHR